MDVQAHELLPRPVIEYLQQHPHATTAEIEAFINAQTPAFAAKLKNKTSAEVLRIITARQTSIWDNTLDFMKLGVKHILSGPDHILFVLSLLLVFSSIKDILRLTSTFTIAHSITLILSGTGVFTLPSKYVEPLIAISIAYVAFTTVFLAQRRFFGHGRSKIMAVFFFGLFHGLGFAGLLKEIQIPADRFLSSLVSFNIGIEVGQLIIVSLALPVIYVFRKRRLYPQAVKLAGATIGGIGLFWAIERIIRGFVLRA
ncbi:MAG: HupE/UreJ family protein [Candidatus Kerfeldbacteria bacterium]|nr:HupE/UreJ family protein [Candidatus Kerfeldbacteria bacterium]